MTSTVKFLAGLTLATTLIAPEIIGGIDRDINAGLRGAGILPPGATVESSLSDYYNWIRNRIHYGEGVGTRHATGQAFKRIKNDLAP